MAIHMRRSVKFKTQVRVRQGRGRGSRGVKWQGGVSSKPKWETAGFSSNFAFCFRQRGAFLGQWDTAGFSSNLGILVFASVMATLGLQIILESVRTLTSDDYEFNLTKEQERWVVGIMLSVTIIKLLLVVYCRSFTNEIVKAYAQDHFFDVITNIIGLIAALLANYNSDWMDPIGAIILALYTIRTWSLTVLENVNSLVGRSAAPHYLQKLTYLCWNQTQSGLTRLGHTTLLRLTLFCQKTCLCKRPMTLERLCRRSLSFSPRSSVLLFILIMSTLINLSMHRHIFCDRVI